jgi:hypothetical protein
VFGLIGLASCWYGISGEANYNNQVGWLVGAVGALVFSAFGIVGWLLSGIREVHREMIEVITVIRTENLHQPLELPADSFAVSLSAAAPATAPAKDLTFVTNASMTRVHRPGCQHVIGRVVEEIEPTELARRGLTFCGVCCG